MAATRAYGAEVVQYGDIYDDAYEKSLEIQRARDLTYIHPLDNQTLVAGQGTLGLEISQELADIGTVVVPIGGGGLISGVSMAMKSRSPNVKIIGVESSGAPAMKLSIAAGHRITLEQIGCIVDGLVVRTVGEYNFEVVQRFVDDIVLVSDDEIFETIVWLMQRCKIVVEGAAATVAAIRYGKIPKVNGATVCVLSGGNLNTSQIDHLK